MTHEVTAAFRRLLNASRKALRATPAAETPLAQGATPPIEGEVVPALEAPPARQERPKP